MGLFSRGYRITVRVVRYNCLCACMPFIASFKPITLLRKRKGLETMGVVESMQVRYSDVIVIQ